MEPPITYGNRYQCNRCPNAIGNIEVIKNVNANILCITGQVVTLNAVNNKSNSPGICHLSEENKK
jgi:hypothetical protein